MTDASDDKKKEKSIIRDLISSFLSMYVLFLNIIYCINMFLDSSVNRISFGMVGTILGRI
ncbi:hypothetical protein Scep_016767 [Stephania cephalantha]|uniref:Uncharacterized protein n=1 Tax=Stephania cephalantha TaxID=152367 RepID=A0AAP0NUG5_9MAGN